MNKLYCLLCVTRYLYTMKVQALQNAVARRFEGIIDATLEMVIQAKQANETLSYSILFILPNIYAQYN